MSNSYTEATDRKSTMGLDHFGKKYTVGEKDLKLQLWDTGGTNLVHDISGYQDTLGMI